MSENYATRSNRIVIHAIDFVFTPTRHNQMQLPQMASMSTSSSSVCSAAAVGLSAGAGFSSSSYSTYNSASSVQYVTWGTGRRRLTRGMATLRHGNQEPLAVKDEVGRPQVSLGCASPWNAIIFPSVLLTLLGGWQEGHPACKNTVCFRDKFSIEH